MEEDISWEKDRGRGLGPQHLGSIIDRMSVIQRTDGLYSVTWAVDSRLKVETLSF